MASADDHFGIDASKFNVNAKGRFPLSGHISICQGARFWL
jgi:hypothetical protein